MLPARGHAVMFVYRDRNTGRFASHSTWKRSKAHGGSRYVRKAYQVRLPPRLQAPAVRPAAHPERESVSRKAKRVTSLEEYEEAFGDLLDETENVESSPDYEESEGG